jgi:hypothetical protein
MRQVSDDSKRATASQKTCEAVENRDNVCVAVDVVSELVVRRIVGDRPKENVEREENLRHSGVPDNKLVFDD